VPHIITPSFKKWKKNWEILIRHLDIDKPQALPIANLMKT
jgi:hypothetical protein